MPRVPADTRAATPTAQDAAQSRHRLRRDARFRGLLRAQERGAVATTFEVLDRPSKIQRKIQRECQPDGTALDRVRMYIGHRCRLCRQLRRVEVVYVVILAIEPVVAIQADANFLLQRITHAGINERGTPRSVRCCPRSAAWVRNIASAGWQTSPPAPVAKVFGVSPGRPRASCGG